MSSLSPTELLQHLEAFKEDDVEALPVSFRARLQRAARNVSLALETPSDAIARLLITDPAEAVMVRIAADLGIFSTLGNKTLSISELARKTGAQPELLGRVLRGLAAFKAVKQVDLDLFAASPRHALLQKEDFQTAFGACQDVLDKIWKSLPAFLAETRYKCPIDPLDTAVQYAYGTKGRSFYESILSEAGGASAIQSFATLMSTWADGFAPVQDVYPVEERLGKGFGPDPAIAMFVDVGGGYGQKTIALKQAFPKLPGRFVVQDLPPRIAKAKELEAEDGKPYTGIELMSHDFLTEQPEKGARCYYIRQCLHNWQEGDCVEILKRLKDAATPGYSRILIHEIVVPNKGASPWAVSQDIEMLSFFATGERTEEDWRSICEKAGLEVAQVYSNGHPDSEAIIEINA